MWRKKKRWFSSLPDLTIVTPSQWLAGFVKDSYLKEHSVRVIHNGIDLNVFSPSDSASVKEKYNLQNKKILLGIASSWSDKKGLPDFVKLSSMLDDTYKIVMVGVSEKQRKTLPTNILALPRTNNARELAEIYTAANVLFNPTYEDNFPTVNLEAQACGTPVITYRTGGTPETITDPRSVVVDQGDLEVALHYIKNVEQK